jgi:hypothetical protein
MANSNSSREGWKRVKKREITSRKKETIGGQEIELLNLE